MSRALAKSPVHRLLAQPGQAGIYHLPHGYDAALEKAANDLGFAFFKVNFDLSDKLPEILSALGRDLGFPDWYGANLDALGDCLTDFSWHEAPGYVITIAGADTLHATPASFAALNEVFTAAIAHWQANEVPLWILYDLRSDGLASLPTLA
jgi:RNAse (barnase) inhibitor barstar